MPRIHLSVMTAGSSYAEDVCVEGGERDLGRLWLLLFCVIVHTVRNPAMFHAVQCASISPLPPSPASVGFWLLHLCGIYMLVHQLRVYWGKESRAARLFRTHYLTQKGRACTLHSPTN